MTNEKGKTSGRSIEALTATVTIGVDGRLYFHEVTPAILAVAAAICPEGSKSSRWQTAGLMTEREGDDCHASCAQEE